MINTPDWAKDAIWYQIFPDRFRNGNPHANPTLKDQIGAAPHDQTSPWQLHPWTSDWYARAEYEKQNNHTIWHNILRRRYGGDLQGILEKLDYLQDLGITALYLNPVFDSPSHHKYDGACYHHVDPTLGPDPVGDRELVKNEIYHDPKTWVWTRADKLLLELIQEGHHRGMRIILDGVFNHLSVVSPPFKDVQKNQQQSPYKNWFKIRSFADKEKGTKFVYDGWWGVPELPELKQNRLGLLAGPKKYIYAATERWMAPDGKVENGIDGWRLDVAHEIAHPFWKDWRKHVKRINPDAFLTGEIFDKWVRVRNYLQGDEFDAMMNYHFAFSAFEYFLPHAQRISTQKFLQDLKNLRQVFHPELTSAMQNLYDSHDAIRISSNIANAHIGKIRDWSEYHNRSKASNPAISSARPTPEHYNIQKLMALFKLSYVGAPMIYYGDECGMWGANDPCCRKPMMWDDMTFDDEKYAADESLLPEPNPVAFDQQLHAYYRKLIRFRNGSNALKTGEFNALTTAKNAFVVERKKGEESVLVAVNRGEQSTSLSVKLEPGQKIENVLRNELFTANDAGEVSLKLDSVSGGLFKLV